MEERGWRAELREPQAPKEERLKVPASLRR